MSRIICICLFALVFSQTAMSDDKRNHNGRSVVRGIAVTGINDLLGSPIGPGPSFQLLGEHDPSADEPRPLTPETPEHAILATRYPLDLLSLFFGIVPGENGYPNDTDNVPLHENPVPVAPSIQFRMQVAPASVATAIEPSRRDEDPITLGDWLDAKGKAYVNCSRDGSRASVFFVFRGLVGNGLYTLWAVPSNPMLLPTAFGGVPNVFTANHRGSAFVHRKVAYCPTNGDLLDITAAYHSDGMVYGNFPDATLDGFTSGIVTHDHVVFPLLEN